MAANQAEVDLIVSAAGALPDLERQLSQIVRTAENGAPEVDVQASLAIQNSLAVMSTQLDQVLRGIDATDPSVDVEAALDAQSSLRNLRNDLDELTRAAARGTTDIVELEAVLDFPRSLAEVTEAVNDLVADVQRVAPEIEVDVDVDEDAEREITRTTRALNFLGRTSVTTGKGLLSFGKGVSQISLATAGGANAVATLVAALQQVGPAAAVATQAMLAQKLVAGTLQVAMIGVSDAIEIAFDPDAKPEDLQKALEQLAPEARRFVVGLRDMRKELRTLQQGVQNRVFQDLDEALSVLGTQVLPDVRRALNSTADALNGMARETTVAALRLSKSGVLGQALDGATQGLTNLERVPGRLATSFTLLSAAAAPAFDRITRAVDRVTASVVERLQRSFESGGLERAINGAIDTFVQLGRVVGNFAVGVGNIFQGLTSDGGGLFDILESISGAFARLTASKEFQAILNELSLTAQSIVSNVLPLLQEAFVQLEPVIAELAPVVREFIDAIGPELIPIIEELGPILVDIAMIMREQLPLAIDIAKAAIGALKVALQVVAVAMDVARKGSEKFSDFMESDFARAMGSGAKFASSNGELIQSAFIRWTSRATELVSSTNQAITGFSRDIRDRVVSAFVEMVSDVISNIQGFRDDLIGFFRALPNELYQVGVDIMSGLAGGLTAGISRVLSIARGVANEITSTIREALDSHSPSRVAIGIGEDYDKGLEIGLRNGQGSLDRTARQIAQSLTSPFDSQFRELSSRSDLLRLPERGATPVNVYLGNEFLARYVDGRVHMIDNRNRRVLAAGVRL